MEAGRKRVHLPLHAPAVPNLQLFPSLSVVKFATALRPASAIAALLNNDPRSKATTAVATAVNQTTKSEYASAI